MNECRWYRRLRGGHWELVDLPTGLRWLQVPACTHVAHARDVICCESDEGWTAVWVANAYYDERHRVHEGRQRALTTIGASAYAALLVYAALEGTLVRALLAGAAGWAATWMVARWMDD